MEAPSSHAFLESALRKLLLPNMPARPFICSESPFDCQIAIVGINPATTTPFWKYWSEEQGFNRAGWIADYKANPANRRNQTRPRIERLVQGLDPLRVIELNAYPYATPNEQALTTEMRDIRVFELMLRVAKPSLVFTFGNGPSRELGKILDIPNLAKGEYTDCAFGDHSFAAIAESHLSRGWSYARVEELAKSIKQRLCGQAANPLLGLPRKSSNGSL
ncbi:MAG: hypothetical protein ACREVW_04605 [Burkholderiales bacterium]